MEKYLIGFLNKYLAVVLDPSLTWNAHVDYLVGNVRQRVALLGPIMKNINVHDRHRSYVFFSPYS